MAVVSVPLFETGVERLQTSHKACQDVKLELWVHISTFTAVNLEQLKPCRACFGGFEAICI